MRRALRGGDLLAARTAASELSHVGLGDAASLLALIATREPDRLEPAAVRFLGRVCLEQSPALADARLLAACLAQLGDVDPELRVMLDTALRRVGVASATANSIQPQDEKIEVPLTAEEAVTEKRVVAKERISLDKDVETETDTVSEQLRKERVEIEGDVHDTEKPADR